MVDLRDRVLAWHFLYVAASASVLLNLGHEVVASRVVAGLVELPGQVTFAANSAYFYDCEDVSDRSVSMLSPSASLGRAPGFIFPGAGFDVEPSALPGGVVVEVITEAYFY